MANKCTSCGKFAPVTDSIKCARCSLFCHRACAINISPSSKVPKWVCKGCKAKACSPVGVKDTHAPDMGSSVPIAQTAIDEEDTDGLLIEQIKLLRLELVAVTHEVTSFRKEICSLKTTLLEVGKRVDKVEERISALEERTSSCSESQVLEEITQLKMELNERDQAGLLNDIEITGIPERSGENLQRTVNLIKNKIGIKLEEVDVVYAERTGSRHSYTLNGETTRPRAIVVRLAKRTLRDQLLRAARIRRGADTSGLELDCQPMRFYVNERLTKFNRQLFFKAREAGRHNSFQYIWTRDGRIYARRDRESIAHRLRTENDICKIVGQSSL